ncbi:hypothetical protein B0H14DRAFT_2689307 [Mycena olivaceomarginata]|nr:hypothetical protein B0H14DRAFT_2825964 [Mycena olivaceomarginata]KAJ7891006.1 hypothetical protein B0H14DRAFT_2689307 [Mycena olivaceomarginata]
MFTSKALLSAVAAAIFVGTATAFNGTATLGFYDTANCGCPPWNGPYAVAIPRELAGTEVCCNVGITLTYLDNTVDAVFSGYYDDATGTENIALSAAAFAALAGHPEETSLAPVAWSFDH